MALALLAGIYEDVDVSDNDTNSDMYLQAYRNNRLTHAHTRNNNNNNQQQGPGLASGPGLTQRQGTTQTQGLAKGQGHGASMAPSYQQQYLHPQPNQHQVSEAMIFVISSMKTCSSFLTFVTYLIMLLLNVRTIASLPNP